MENYRLTQTGEEVQEILNGAAMQTDLTAEVERAEGAEQTLQGNIDEEERRAKAAEETLSGAIGDEELRAKAAEEALGGAIDGINAKIPAAASSENKLADQDFVNSSIETATATFRGTFNLVSDLHLAVDATHEQIATLLGTVIAEADNNDYSYVLIPTSAQTPTEIASIEKYTFGANGWAFAYALNNSGFTSAQWAAINSGITSGLVAKLNALPTNTDLLALLAGKQDVLTFDDVPVEGSNNPVKSGGVHSAIDDEKTARVNAMNQLSGRVDTIEGEIPAQASSENQLADKAYVNSSISTNTATYRGSFNLVADLGLSVSATHEQIGTALAGEISTADNNDYAYVQVPTSDETPSQILKVERYKFNGTAWAFEYELNNSGFTSAQWAALNSGITSGLVGKLNALPTNDELTLALAGKQDVLTFDNTPTENSNNPVKSGGVYAADKALSDAIEAILLLIPSAATSLNKLVDTDLMNSSISTATATFRGTFNLVSDLSLDLTATHAQIATALAGEIATADNNDYCFVQIPTAVGTPTEIAQTDRYKFNGTAWAYEYTLNTSGFTSVQWAAINSGITAALVTSLADIPDLIPSEATSANQLADKAYVLAQILAATPAFKGQFVTLAELQAVASPKAGDLGIVRTKDSDGMDVFTVYQYLNNAWNVFYSLSYHPQTKPATTGTTGDYPYNGMGRVELAKNIVNTGTDLEPVMVNQLTQDMFYKGAVGSRVPNTNTIFVIRYDYVLAENITIPDNCVLEFDGGSISGAYTITGTNTGIIADYVQIFDGVDFSGSWNVKTAYVEWYGTRVNEGSPTSVCASVSANKMYKISQHVMFPRTGNYYSYSGTTIQVKYKLTGTLEGRAGGVGTTIIFSNMSNGQSCVLVGVSEGEVADRDRGVVISDITINHIPEGKVQCSALELGAVSGCYITGVYALEQNKRSAEFNASDLADIYSVCNYGIKFYGDSEIIDITNSLFEGDIAVYAKRSVDFLNVNNVELIAGGYGFASIAGASLGSAIHFRNLSMNQGIHAIYLTETDNVCLFDGFRSEQLRALTIGSVRQDSCICINGKNNPPYLANITFRNGLIPNSVNGIKLSGFASSSIEYNLVVFEEVGCAGFYNDSYALDVTGANDRLRLTFKDCQLYRGAFNLRADQYLEGATLRHRSNADLGPFIRNATLKFAVVMMESFNTGPKVSSRNTLVFESEETVPLLDVSQTGTSAATCKAVDVFYDSTTNKTLGYICDIEIFGANTWAKARILVKYNVTGSTVDIGVYSGTLLSKEGDDIFTTTKGTSGTIAWEVYNGAILFYNYKQADLVAKSKLILYQMN